MTDPQNGAKVALVTGGTKRLGLEFARALAKSGYSLALAYRSDPKRARRAVDRLRKEEGAAPKRSGPISPPTMRPLPYSKKSSLRLSILLYPLPLRPLVSFSSSVPRLDALVHAASPWIPKPFSSVTVSDWEAVFRAGPRAAFFLAQAAAPALRAARGSILLVSDVAATQAWPSHIPHAAAKAAINALVGNLAVALGPEVRVNAIAPGVVMPPADMSAEAIAKLVRKTPLGRPVAVDDVTSMAVAILRNHSMTGQVVAVDAGRTIRGD